MAASHLLSLLLAAAAVQNARAQQVVLQTVAVPFFLPSSLQGQVPPTAVSVVGTPEATAPATTYTVDWPAFAGSQGLSLLSNPSSLVATQTAYNAQGVLAPTQFNCDLQPTPAPGQAICTVVDAAAGISYVDAPEIMNVLSTLPVVVSSTTIVPVVTSAAAVPEPTSAPVESSAAAVSSAPSSGSDTVQAKSANVFAPAAQNGAVDLRWEGAVLSIIVGTVIAVVCL